MAKKNGEGNGVKRPAKATAESLGHGPALSGVVKDGDRYLRIEFADGSAISLLPVNYDAKTTPDVRDGFVQWLRAGHLQ